MIRKISIRAGVLLPWTLGAALAALPFSIILCHGALVTAILCWVAEGKWQKKWNRLRESALLQLHIIFMTLLLIGLTYTENTAEGWFNIERKIFLFIIPLVVATTDSITPDDIRRLMYYFVGANLVAIVICLGTAAVAWHHFNNGLLLPDNRWLSDPTAAAEIARTGAWFFFSYTPLASGIGMHPTYMGVYCLFCCLFLFIEMNNMTTSSKQMATGGIIIVFGIFLALLASRVVLLTAVAFFVIAAASYVSRRSLTSRLTLAGVFVGMVSLSYFNPISQKRSVEEVALTPVVIEENRHYAKSTEIRASLWWLGIDAWKQSNIFFGGGTGDVLLLMERTAGQHGITNVINNYNPHNQFIYLLVGNGALTLFVFVLYLTVPAIRALRSGNLLLVGFTLIICAASMTETILELQKGIAFFAMIHPSLVILSASRSLIVNQINFAGADNG